MNIPGNFDIVWNTAQQNVLLPHYPNSNRQEREGF